MFDFISRFFTLYRSLIKAFRVVIGGWTALFFILMALYYFSLLWQIQFFSEYKDFLSDLNHLAISSSPFAELDFFTKYQIDRSTLEMLAAVTPARPIALGITPLASFDKTFLYMGWIFIWGCIGFLQIYVPRFYGLKPYALEESKKAWVLSIGIVTILAGVQSYLDFTPVMEKAGTSFWLFWFMTLSMTYSGGFLFFVLRYFVDAYLLSKGKDPQKTWIDEVVILAVAVPFLLLAGNGLLDISFEAIAGMSPFLIVKMMKWNWKAPESPTHEVDAMFEEKGFFIQLCDMIIGLSVLAILFALVAFGFDGSKKTSSSEKTSSSGWIAFEEEKLRKKLNKSLWDQYIKGKDQSFDLRSLTFLASAKEKYQRDTVAAIYAWIGQEKKAKKLAEQALPSTKERVKLLLEGKKPYEVEKSIKLWEKKRQ